MNLEKFFKEHNRIALAFSGGVDSSYLLYMAMKYKVRIRAYYVDTQFQPTFELEDAKRVAQEVGANLTILRKSILEVEQVVENPDNRCYYCKQKIFGFILEEAQKDGFTEIMDGTNATDEVHDRPGMKALQEMRVYSPLRLCGIGKSEVRRESKEIGLFTWDKPSYACLATRIPVGTQITLRDLERVENGEALLHGMGYRDFRIRIREDMGVIQVTKSQMDKIIKERERVRRELVKWFPNITLDLHERNTEITVK